jgi:hypothetical protein
MNGTPEGLRSSEGVHSLGWEGQEEERWWKIRIVVGEYQWVVSFLSCEWTVRDHPLLWITSLNSGVTVVEIWNNQSMVGWNIHPKQLVAQHFKR